MMRIGDMRHILRIEVQSDVLTQEGDRQQVWNLVTERRAAMRRDPGTELNMAPGRVGRVLTQFRVRYLAGVAPNMRALLVSVSPLKVYNIVGAIDPDGKQETLLITADELVEETA